MHSSILRILSIVSSITISATTVILMSQPALARNIPYVCYTLLSTDPEPLPDPPTIGDLKGPWLQSLIGPLMYQTNAVASVVSDPDKNWMMDSSGIVCWGTDDETPSCNDTFETPVGTITSNYSIPNVYQWGYKNSVASQYAMGGPDTIVTYSHQLFLNARQFPDTYDNGTWHEADYQYHGSKYQYTTFARFDRWHLYLHVYSPTWEVNGTWNCEAY